MFSFFIPHGKDPDSYRDVVIEKLRKFAAVAEKHDVILLHENEKDIYGDTGARCRVIFEALASPHFRAAFDFANFVQCGEDTEKCWELLRPYIEYIHIKDAVSHDKENVLCGTGEGKIKALLTRAIRDEGYEGFLTLERIWCCSRRCSPWRRRMLQHHQEEQGERRRGGLRHAVPRAQGDSGRHLSCFPGGRSRF